MWTHCGDNTRFGSYIPAKQKKKCDRCSVSHHDSFDCRTPACYLNYNSGAVVWRPCVVQCKETNAFIKGGLGCAICVWKGQETGRVVDFSVFLLGRGYFSPLSLCLCTSACSVGFVFSLCFASLTSHTHAHGHATLRPLLTWQTADRFICLNACNLA